SRPCDLSARAAQVLWREGRPVDSRHPRASAGIRSRADVNRNDLKFWLGLALAGFLPGTPPAVAPPTTHPARPAEYGDTPPPGWTTKQYPDGIVLMSPVSATNEVCVVTVWPMRPAGTNLLADASSIFQDVYKTYEPRTQTNRGTPMPSSVVRGTSGQG